MKLNQKFFKQHFGVSLENFESTDWNNLFKALHQKTVHGVDSSEIITHIENFILTNKTAHLVRIVRNAATELLFQRNHKGEKTLPKLRGLLEKIELFSEDTVAEVLLGKTNLKLQMAILEITRGRILFSQMQLLGLVKNKPELCDCILQTLLAEERYNDGLIMLAYLPETKRGPDELTKETVFGLLEGAEKKYKKFMLTTYPKWLQDFLQKEFKNKL